MALIALSYLAGAALPSPWREASTNSAITPVVTADVVRRPFTTQSAQAGGTLHLGSSVPVVPSTGDGQVVVVTASTHTSGDTIRSGQVVIEVSGRPIIFLRLPFPLFRDLHRGDRGDDVTALQQALTDAGLYGGAVDGSFDSRTVAAVALMYSRVGAVTPSSQAADAQVAPVAGAGSTTVIAAGAFLPRAEILAANVPSLSVVTIAKVGTVLGEEGTSVGELRGGLPRVSARVPVSEKNAFTVGTEVVVVALADAGRTATGVVRDVGAFTAGADAVPAGFDATIEVAGVGDAWQDEDRVTVAPTDAEDPTRDALAVPLTAIREDAEGTYVLTSDAGSSDQFSTVRVEVGLQDSGWAEVAGGDLALGQRVVVAGR